MIPKIVFISQPLSTIEEQFSLSADCADETDFINGELGELGEFKKSTRVALRVLGT